MSNTYCRLNRITPPPSRRPDSGDVCMIPLGYGCPGCGLVYRNFFFPFGKVIRKSCYGNRPPSCGGGGIDGEEAMDTGSFIELFTEFRVQVLWSWMMKSREARAWGRPSERKALRKNEASKATALVQPQHAGLRLCGYPSLIVHRLGFAGI